MVYGSSPYTQLPSWNIQGSSLKVEDAITFLGAGFALDGGASHVMARTKAATRAFYSLQHAGLHYKGLSTEAAAYLFTIGVQTSLTYGAEAIHINATNMKLLKKTQGNLLKAMLGLKRSCHTTPILEALNIPSIPMVIGIQGLNLLRSTLLHESGATAFYNHILSKNHEECGQTLINRVHSALDDVDIVNYIFDNKYNRSVQMLYKAKTPSGVNGVVDSIRDLFHEYNDNARNLVHMLICHVH